MGLVFSEIQILFIANVDGKVLNSAIAKSGKLRLITKWQAMPDRLSFVVIALAVKNCYVMIIQYLF